VLTPIRLRFKAAGRFVDEQIVEFTTLGSFVQVEGKNANTGGSSGTGKTTFLRMVEYNLGLNDLPVSILQSRFTKDPFSTFGEYDWDGTPVTIERGKSKFSITVGDQVTTGSSKITEEKLDEIIGMPRDLFRKILHKRQGEGGFFLDMGPSDVHKFLTSCLKLEEEQKKILKLDEILKARSTQEVQVKSEVESNRTGLEASKNALNSLGEAPKPSFNADYIETLKLAHTVAYDLYSASKSEYESEKAELEKSRPTVSVSPFDRSAIENSEAILKEITKKANALEAAELSRQSEVKSQISAIQLEISNLQKIEQSRQSDALSKVAANRLEANKASNIANQGDQAKEAAKRLAVELNKIRTAICPTCEQGWLTDSIKVKEAEMLKTLDGYRKTVLAASEALKIVAKLNEDHAALILETSPKALPEIDVLNAKISDLRVDSGPRAIPEVQELRNQYSSENKQLEFFRQQEKEHQNKENIKNQDILVEFAKKQSALGHKHEAKVKSLWDLERKSLSDHEMALVKQKSFEAEFKRYTDSLSKIHTQISNYESIVTQKSSNLVSIQEEIEILEESKKAIKSHLSCSFDDALESIGDKATRLIRRIPNMANATIQFEGLKETGTGKIKEEVTCLVSMDGEVGVPLKSLSGGERSSCDMCVDLSIIKFIEETTNNGIGIYVIDEGFNGLDTTCIQDALEMLREYSVDKKLFLVEHNPIVSESIENRILVVRDGLTSKIVQQ